MYQAIVFLPLLGFLIAGLISIAGARQRFPGGYPAPGEHHGHAAHAHAHAAEEPHDDHHGGGPAASWSREAELATTGLLFASMVLSWIALFYVGFGHHETR